MDIEERSETSKQASGVHGSAQKRQKRKFKETASKKRKHTSLTIDQKIDICKAKENKPSIKNVELAVQYDVGESTISDILKKKQHYLSLQTNEYTGGLCRERTSKFPSVEHAVALWIDQATEDNCTLSGHIVVAKAADFARRLGIN